MMPKSKDSDIIEGFLHMLQATRFASANTIEAYHADLNWLLAKIEQYGFADLIKKPHLLHISSSQLQEILYKQNLEKSLSDATIIRRSSTFRQFFQYLLMLERREDDPTAFLETRKAARNLPKVISSEAIDALIATAWQEAQKADGEKYFRYMRVHVVLMLLYATGMRIGELCSLPITALRYDEKGDVADFLLIKGKGKKERIVFLHKSAQQALQNWLALRSKIRSWTKNHYVFPSSGNSEYVARQVISRHIKKVAQKAGVPEFDVYPHIFRHAFASHLLQNDCDLRVLQELLGHSNISTTQIYTHVLEDKLVETVEKYHPLACKQNSL